MKGTFIAKFKFKFKVYSLNTNDEKMTKYYGQWFFMDFWRPIKQSLKRI